MSMTPYQLSRLEKLEQFMDRLKLNSYIAKASAEGTRNPVLDYQDHERRLEQLERSGTVAKAPKINPRTGLPNPSDLERRLNALEAHYRRIDSRLDRLDEHYRDLIARDTTGTVSAGEAVLAKAQGAARRANTPQGLLARAQAVLSDPSAVGEVSSYVQMGQLAKAAEIVQRAEEEHDRAAENAALETARQGVGGDVVQRLTDDLAQSKSVISALLQRVGRLEAAQQRTPAPTPARTVAKAQGPRRERYHDEMPSASELMTRANGVIDSAALIGTLSSMAQEGRLAEVLKVVEQAELSHESRLKAAQRKALR